MLARLLATYKADIIVVRPGAPGIKIGCYKIRELSDRLGRRPYRVNSTILIGNGLGKQWRYVDVFDRRGRLLLSLHAALRRGMANTRPAFHVKRLKCRHLTAVSMREVDAEAI